MNSSYQQFLNRVLRTAGQVALGHFREGVSHQTKRHMGDLVTQADHDCSNLIVSEISRGFPEHGIYSEELDQVIQPEAPRRWLIDPIDGTRNFAHGIPLWCIMVALYEGDNAICSAIYAPVVDEFYFAESGRGASLNGRPIHAVARDNFDHVMGIGVCNPEGVEFKRFHRAHYELNKINGWIHNMGSNLAAAYLAAGKLDFYFNNCGQLHDHAPVALLCREAGARVTDCEGADWKPGRKDLLMSREPLYSQLLKFFLERGVEQ